MISYKEAHEEVSKLKWPDGVTFDLSRNMMFLTLDYNQLARLNPVGILLLEEATTKAMTYLRNVNPAITLRVAQ